ncbi:acyl-CoA N-acyltransferase [Lenzites betulinus]|nr:acyl-CoA N-acyltransferase [Lenzites betulinus]
MSQLQFRPLQFNEKGEPFLRLPSPHENIIITVPRMSDAPTIISYMNDPAVYNMLEGPPFPYLPEHAEWWLTDITKGTDAALEELRRASAEHPDTDSVVVSSCPVRIIREVREDGTDLLLGDIAILRERWPDVMDQAEKESLAKPNADRPIGDLRIIWCIGDYIAPSHQGKGIMTAALKTLIHEWAVPRMGVRQLRVETFSDNIGSRRVFEKLGFVHEKTVPLENKILNSGRKISGMEILWWQAE